MGRTASEGPSAASRSVEAALREERIRYVMRTDPLSLPSGTALGDVLQAMRRRRVSYALITERERLVGIFTERDYLLKVAGARARLTESIDKFMTRDPKTLTPDDSLEQVLQSIVQGGYRHLPVTENGGVKGMVVALDIVKYVAELFPTEVFNLPPYLDQVMPRVDGA